MYIHWTLTKLCRSKRQRENFTVCICTLTSSTLTTSAQISPQTASPDTSRSEPGLDFHFHSGILIKDTQKKLKIGQTHYTYHMRLFKHFSHPPERAEHWYRCGRAEAGRRGWCAGEAGEGWSHFPPKSPSRSNHLWSAPGHIQTRSYPEKEREMRAGRNFISCLQF